MGNDLNVFALASEEWFFIARQFNRNDGRLRQMKRIATLLCAVALLSGTSTLVQAEDAAKKCNAKADIVDTAVEAGQFKTLAAALTEAGLVEALKGDGPFTVFAPTDEAFAKLPDGTVENLLKPENRDQLVAILKYHVVAGKVTAAKVVKLHEVKTLNGESVKISAGDSVMINNAKVVKADIMTSNGVIHVIDTVLLP